MDLSDLSGEVAAAPAVLPTGSRTQWEVGDDAGAGRDVRAPSGVVRHDPADLTVTVGAGTTVEELSAVLAAHGQECPLDPHDAAATVGGVLSCGLSGHRRLRHGPVRDRVLEVRFVTGDGRVVRGGGPTVKNVSGYDLPRLLVGSFGTLGVLAQVTLRCQPLPKAAVWLTGESDEVDPFRLHRLLFRPSCIAWDGSQVWCLLEGHPSDVEAEARATGLHPVAEPPAWPAGPCRGRVSVRPGALPTLAAALGGVAGLRWVAEVGVGTVHVAADAPGPVEEARRLATAHDGWLLREAGPLDGFGRPLPNAGVMRRLKEALDPAGKVNPGRLPL